MKLRWLSTALSELDRVFDYISGESPLSARRVLTRIRDATRNLERFPESGRPGHVNGTRELVVAGLPYLIVYRIYGDVIEILRVFHTSQGH